MGHPKGGRGVRPSTSNTSEALGFLFFFLLFLFLFGRLRFRFWLRLRRDLWLRRRSGVLRRAIRWRGRFSFRLWRWRGGLGRGRRRTLRRTIICRRWSRRLRRRLRLVGFGTVVRFRAIGFRCRAVVSRRRCCSRAIVRGRRTRRGAIRLRLCGTIGLRSGCRLIAGTSRQVGGFPHDWRCRLRRRGLLHCGTSGGRRLEVSDFTANKRLPGMRG
jgi:hypothetical protein